MASRKSQKAAANPINQTIRVQIDLPYDTQSANAHTPNSICLHINFENNNNSAIQVANSAKKCLVSSSSSRRTPSQATKRTTTGCNLHDVSMCSLTSGYSTSSLHSSSSSSTSSDSQNNLYKSNQAFCLETTCKCDDDQLLTYSTHSVSSAQDTVYLNESHLYDRLSYPNSVTSKTPRQFANASSRTADEEERESDENTTAYSNGINFAHEKTTTVRRPHHRTTQHIYEDITNFRAVKLKSEDSSYEHMGELSSASSSYTTRTSQVKRLNAHESPHTTAAYPLSQAYKPKKSIYKREYTVNEIFQNVKKFKEQAKEQEIFNESTTRTVQNSAKSEKPQSTSGSNHLLTSDHIKSSVSIIKQIFEMKSKCDKSVVSSLSTLRATGPKSAVDASKPNQPVTKLAVEKPSLRPEQHTYVNEKLPPSINV